MKRSFLSLFNASLAMVLFVTSCVRDVTLDAGEKPVVVVECVLKNCDVQELRLNFTKGASETEAKPLTDAVATLRDLTMTMDVGQFVRKEGDLWTLDYSPVPYHEYLLEIQIPDYDPIYAQETMPGKVYFKWGGSTTNYRGIDSDYQTDQRYYQGAKSKYLDKSGQLMFIRGSFYVLEDVPNPFLIYGMNYNPLTEQYEIVEELCTDHPAVLSCTLNGETYVPPSIIEDLPRVQLHPYLEGESLHNRYMIFPKGSDQIEQFFVISGSFAGKWYQWTEDTQGYLVFESMSENYYQYLNEAIQIKAIKESSDLSSIYLRNNIHSNINGGIGLFAAIWEERTEWIKCYMNMDVWENFWYRWESDPSQFYTDPYYPNIFFYVDERGNSSSTVIDREGLLGLYKSGVLTEEEYALIGGVYY